MCAPHCTMAHNARGTDAATTNAGSRASNYTGTVDPLVGDPSLLKVRELGCGSFGSVSLYQRTMAGPQPWTEEVGRADPWGCENNKGVSPRAISAQQC